MTLNAQMNTQMNERFNVSGALLVKLFGRHDSEVGAFASRASRVRDIGILSALYGRVFFVALGLVGEQSHAAPLAAAVAAAVAAAAAAIAGAQGAPAPRRSSSTCSCVSQRWSGPSTSLRSSDAVPRPSRNIANIS